MSYKTPNPEEQTPDRELKRLTRRWKSTWTRHQNHREHQGDRRKKRAKH